MRKKLMAFLLVAAVMILTCGCWNPGFFGNGRGDDKVRENTESTDNSDLDDNSEQPGDASDSNQQSSEESPDEWNGITYDNGLYVYSHYGWTNVKMGNSPSAIIQGGYLVSDSSNIYYVTDGGKAINYIDMEGTTHEVLRIDDGYIRYLNRYGSVGEEYLYYMICKSCVNGYRGYPQNTCLTIERVNLVNTPVTREVIAEDVTDYGTGFYIRESVLYYNESMYVCDSDPGEIYRQDAIVQINLESMLLTREPGYRLIAVAGDAIYKVAFEYTNTYIQRVYCQCGKYPNELEYDIGYFTNDDLEKLPHTSDGRWSFTVDDRYFYYVDRYEYDTDCIVEFGPNNYAKVLKELDSGEVVTGYYVLNGQLCIEPESDSSITSEKGSLFIPERYQGLYLRYNNGTITWHNYSANPSATPFGMTAPMGILCEGEPEEDDETESGLYYEKTEYSPYDVCRKVTDDEGKIITVRLEFCTRQGLYRDVHEDLFDSWDYYTGSNYYHYDSEGRLVEMSSCDRWSNYFSRNYYEYDSDGCLLTEKCYDGNWTLRSINDYIYDSNGQVTGINQTKYSYKSCYDASDNTTHEVLYKYIVNECDAELNVLRATYFSSANDFLRGVEYEYDAAGREIKRIDYDKHGTVTEETVKEYDSDGNMTERVKRADGTIKRRYEYEYDYGSYYRAKRTSYFSDGRVEYRNEGEYEYVNLYSVTWENGVAKTGPLEAVYKVDCTGEWPHKGCYLTPDGTELEGSPLGSRVENKISESREVEYEEYSYTPYALMPDSLDGYTREFFYELLKEVEEELLRMNESVHGIREDMNLLTIDDTNYVKFDYIMSKDVNIYGEPIINGSAVGVVCKNDIITRYFISDKDSEVLPELVNESIGDLGTGRFGVSERQTEKGLYYVTSYSYIIYEPWDGPDSSSGRVIWVADENGIVVAVDSAWDCYSMGGGSGWYNVYDGKGNIIFESSYTNVDDSIANYYVSEDGRLEVIYDYYMDYETGITPQIEIYYDGNPITGRQMYSSS